MLGVSCAEGLRQSYVSSSFFFSAPAVLYVCSHAQTTDGAPSPVCYLMVEVDFTSGFHPYYSASFAILPF